MKSSILVTILLFLVVIFITTDIAYSSNPFLNKKDVIEKKTIPPKVKGNIWLKPFIKTSQKYQRIFKQKLTNFAKEMKTDPFGVSFWLFLWFSFLYGVFHALGPGHGKSIAVSFFLSRPGKIMHGFLMGNILTFSHVFSAVILMLILYFIFKSAGLINFDHYSVYLAWVSGILLMGVSVYLIYKSIH